MQRSNLAIALSISVFQNYSHRETNLFTKELYFQSRINYNEIRAATLSSYFFAESFFLRITNCLEQLLRSKYFLVTNTLSNSFFLNINSFSAQLLFQRSFFSRISNYSEYVLFQSRYFFRTVTISEKELFWEQVFLLKKSLFSDNSP